jgi:hypothetical protein
MTAMGQPIGHVQDVFFGPLVAGPEGCTLLKSYAGDVASLHEDVQAYQQMLAERGIVPLQHPGGGSS